jgi:predicted ArsR family transcriptional regulator
MTRAVDDHVLLTSAIALFVRDRQKTLRAVASELDVPERKARTLLEALEDDHLIVRTRSDAGTPVWTLC